MDVVSRRTRAHQSFIPRTWRRDSVTALFRSSTRWQNRLSQQQKLVEEVTIGWAGHPSWSVPCTLRSANM